jgi:amidase
MLGRYIPFKAVVVGAFSLTAVTGNLRAQTPRRPTEAVSGSVFATVDAASERQAGPSPFEVAEATVPQLQEALASGRVTSSELVGRYTARIEAYDRTGPRLNSIRDLDPAASALARELDLARKHGKGGGPLFGIPIILKDNIDKNDQPTTAGSVALEGSIPPEDAFIIRQLREAGAILLAKANLTEFANYLTVGMPAGYSSLGDYVLNPYDPRTAPDGRPLLSPGGSSSGPGVAAAASFAAATIGTETSGSILSPANQNSLVGIKPTVGLASRTGIIPIASSQDTAGPLARTVTDAAILLGAITAADPDDPATQVPDRVVYTDYTPFLEADALRGARIGIAFGRNTAGNPVYYYYGLTSAQRAIIDAAADVMRGLGADVFFVEIETAQALSSFNSSVLRYEFKRDLNAYLSTLPPSAAVHSLADVIAFNDAYPDQTRFRFGQSLARASEATDLDAERPQYLADRATDLRLSRDEIDRVIGAHNLDALLFGANNGAAIGAKAGYPSLIVPGGYLSSDGSPYGVTFTGAAWSEPRLIGLAYAFEQSAQARRPPESTPPLAAAK